jgi:hypothetical protein
VLIVHYSRNSCRRRSVAPWTLFYQDTQYSQLGWFTNLLWCDIPLNKAPQTGPYHIWHIYKLCPFYGHEKNTDDRVVGWMISLASVCYCDSPVRKHFFIPSLVSAIRIFTDGFLLEFDFFPSHCNSSLQQSALFTLLCMTRQSCSNPMPLRYERLLQW